MLEYWKQGLNLNEKVFSKMAKEIPLYAERFALVDTPDEYYSSIHRFI
jgi:hypothetical protein